MTNLHSRKRVKDAFFSPNPFCLKKNHDRHGGAKLGAWPSMSLPVAPSTDFRAAVHSVHDYLNADAVHLFLPISLHPSLGAVHLESDDNYRVPVPQRCDASFFQCLSTLARGDALSRPSPPPCAAPFSFFSRCRRASFSASSSNLRCRSFRASSSRCLFSSNSC